ncbi:hypothetical protein BGZ73_001154 [Actinomortierella ambigua]|nr:hypothetical protein BGZ73_001154 [Actinomortierella ambigua]
MAAGTSGVGGGTKIFGSFNNNVGNQSWRPSSTRLTTTSSHLPTSGHGQRLTSMPPASPQPYPVNASTKASSTTAAAAAVAATSATIATKPLGGPSNQEEDNDPFLEGDDLDLEALMDDNFGDIDGLDSPLAHQGASTASTIPSKRKSASSPAFKWQTSMPENVVDDDDNLLPPNISAASGRSPKKMASARLSSSKTAATVTAKHSTALLQIKQEAVEDDMRLAARQDRKSNTTAPSLASTNMRSTSSSTTLVVAAGSSNYFESTRGCNFESSSNLGGHNRTGSKGWYRIESASFSRTAATATRRKVFESIKLFQQCSRVSLSDIPNDESLYQGKIEALVVQIKECRVAELDTSVVVIDPSGEMRGTIHRKVMEHYKNNEIRVGTALALQNISIFSPTPTSHYLNITMANIAGVFLPAPNIISLTQSTVSPKTQQSLSQTSAQGTGTGGGGVGVGEETRVRWQRPSALRYSQTSSETPPSPSRLQQVQEGGTQSSMEFAPKSPTPLHPPTRKRQPVRRPSPDWDEVVEEERLEEEAALKAASRSAKGGNGHAQTTELEMAAGVDYSPVVMEEPTSRNNTQDRVRMQEVAAGAGGEEDEEDEPLVRNRHSDVSNATVSRKESPAPVIKKEPGVEDDGDEDRSIQEIQFQSLPQGTGPSHDSFSKGTLAPRMADGTLTADDSTAFPHLGGTPIGILGGATPREQATPPPPRISPSSRTAAAAASTIDSSSSSKGGGNRALLASFAAPKNLQRRSTFTSPSLLRKSSNGSSSSSLSLSEANRVAGANTNTSTSAAIAQPVALKHQGSLSDDWFEDMDESVLNVADLEDEGGPEMSVDQSHEEPATVPPVAMSAKTTTTTTTAHKLGEVVEGAEDDDFDFLLQDIDESELFDEGL